LSTKDTTSSKTLMKKNTILFRVHMVILSALVGCAVYGIYFFTQQLIEKQDTATYQKASDNAQPVSSRLADTASLNLNSSNTDSSNQPCVQMNAINPFISAATEPPLTTSSPGTLSGCAPFEEAQADNQSASKKDMSLTGLLTLELAKNQSNEHSAVWKVVTPMAEGASNTTTTTHARAGDMASKQNSNADGILINLDKHGEGIGKQITDALNAGQIVVLDTSGGDVNRKKIHDLSLEFGSFGATADTVMLYKSDRHAEVSVLPYDAADKEDLANFMTKVARRRLRALL
jgi:hypothetical protein